MRGMFQAASRAIYMLAATVLMLFALVFVGVAALTVVEGAVSLQPDRLTSALLDAVGLIVLSIAVFEIAKYLFEEEILRDRELRRADESRRTLTKFLTTIIVAASLEGLVLVFEARTTDMAAIVYPSLLLAVVVLMVVGLASFQWIGRRAESIRIDPAASDADEAAPKPPDA